MNCHANAINRYRGNSDGLPVTRISNVQGIEQPCCCLRQIARYGKIIIPRYIAKSDMPFLLVSCSRRQSERLCRCIMTGELPRGFNFVIRNRYWILA